MFAPETERLMESRFRTVDARYAGIDLLASTAESGRAEQVIFGRCAQILHLPRLNKRPRGVERKCCEDTLQAKLQPLVGQSLTGGKEFIYSSYATKMSVGNYPNRER